MRLRNLKGLFSVICSILLILSFTFGIPKSAPAIEKATAVAIGVPTAVFLGAAAFSYFLDADKEKTQRRFPGEFYVGGFIGGSIPSGMDWEFQNVTPGGGNVTASDVSPSAGVVGGAKFGYFFQSCPYLGVEAESNFTRNNLRGQSVSLSPSVRGFSQGQVIPNFLSQWTSSLHLMGRYGFLPDQEVPFGRLQPYVGVGPGILATITHNGYSVNPSLEVEAGIRYMMLKNVSAFVEYKYSAAWGVELDRTLIENPNGGAVATGEPSFDVTNNKIVVGVAYHF
jgi:opacity protein-like surface antigen